MPNLKRPVRLALLTLTAAAISGCGKKETPPPAQDASVAIVAGSARSTSFAATAAHLDVGGPVFCFCETEGDPKRVADSLLQLYAAVAKKQRELPPAPASTDPFLADLGLTNIHATGFSSRRDGAAFVNRSFLYTPGGPAGLTTLFGAKNAAFISPALAPADTIFLGEGELDGARLLAIARAVAAHIGDGKDAPAALEKFLAQPVSGAPVSAGRIIRHLSGKTFVGIQASRTETLALGKNRMPALDFALALDGREPLFREIAALVAMAGKNAPVEKNDEGDFEIITSTQKAPGPFARYAPVFAFQKSTGRVWLASNRATLDAWTKPAGDKLAASPEFKKLGAGLAASGTGLVYVAPDADKPIRELITTGIALVPSSAQRAEVETLSGMYLGALDALFPKNGAGVYAASFLTADGLATESRAPVSHKPNAYMWASNGGAAPVVVTGMMAALAIPAFKKVRTNAVRQVSASANQDTSGGAGNAEKLFVSDVRSKFANSFIPLFREQGGDSSLVKDNGVVKLHISPSGLVTFGGWQSRPTAALVERLVVESVGKMRQVIPPPGGEEIIVRIPVSAFIEE